MKYEKEITNLFKELFYESWMLQNDWDSFFIEVLENSNTSIEKMSNEIEIGINNGYTMEFQFELIKKIFLKKYL